MLLKSLSNLIKQHNPKLPLLLLTDIDEQFQHKFITIDIQMNRSVQKKCTNKSDIYYTLKSLFFQSTVFSSIKRI